MISIATGIIVTRAASEDDLGQEIVTQLISNPKVLYIAAGACFVMTFIIGQFFMIVVAIFLIYLGARLSAIEKEELEKGEVVTEEMKVEEIRKPENVISLLQVDPIELEFGYGIIPLADVNQGGDLLDRVVMIRRQLALELGMIVPIIRLRDNIQLSPSQYVIKIKGVEVSSGELMMDHFMAMNPGTAEEEIDGIPTAEPAFGLPAIWITESQRDRAEMLGYTVVDPPSIIATHMTEVIKKHAHELLGRQDVQTLLDNVKNSYPAIVEELVPKQLSLGEVQKVLANLLREGVSIRDMVKPLNRLSFEHICVIFLRKDHIHNHILMHRINIPFIKRRKYFHNITFFVICFILAYKSGMDPVSVFIIQFQFNFCPQSNLPVFHFASKTIYFSITTKSTNQPVEKSFYSLGGTFIIFSHVFRKKISRQIPNLLRNLTFRIN